MGNALGVVDVLAARQAALTPAAAVGRPEPTALLRKERVCQGLHPPIPSWAPNLKAGIISTHYSRKQHWRKYSLSPLLSKPRAGWGEVARRASRITFSPGRRNIGQDRFRVILALRLTGCGKKALTQLAPSLIHRSRTTSRNEASS